MASVDVYLTSDKRQVLESAQGHLLNGEFESAHRALDSLILTYPDDPAGYLYKAAVYLGEMTDAEEDLHAVEFNALIDTVISLTGGRDSGGSARHAAWMKLWEGHARAYRSLRESRFGSFTSALKQAFEARSCYEEGLKSDSSLYDLYGGLGMFHYWKSAKAGFLRWIGLFKNEKEKGVAELRLAQDSSLISSQAARNALIWIWLDMKEYDSVVVACGELLEQFPHGKLFLWPLAKAYFESERYDLAAETYHLIRDKLVQSPGNYYNIIECDHSLNRCYDKLGLEAEAVRAARLVNEYYDTLSEQTKRRQRSKLDFLRRVAKRDL